MFVIDHHHELKFCEGELAILVLVGELEHLVDLRLGHGHRQVPHDEGEVLLVQGVLLQPEVTNMMGSFFDPSFLLACISWP